MKFEVWAPRAREVKLELGRETPGMERGDGGWWRLERPAESGQTRYRFVVDGGPPRPDPRSRWQPDGVHGASMVWDVRPWRERARARTEGRRAEVARLAEAVIYEMHVGTFTPQGTYGAAREKLAYLRDLGVTHLEVMPLATFPGERGWGYDGVFLYAPHPAYGTPDELAAFVDDCHAHGLGVLLDVVYNHLGPDGNYLGGYGPYFTERWKTPWGDAVNLDGPGSDEVRAFLIENALMWLRDYGFDGLRLDAVHALYDWRAEHVLEELAGRVAALGQEQGRELLLIAESDRNDPRYVWPVARGGYGLHGHWADDFHHAVHAWLTGERASYYSDFGGFGDIVRTLRDGYGFTGQFSPHRQRRHGRRPVAVKPEQLIVCLQNHDQTGNRARGERLSQLVSEEKLKAAAALLLLGPYTPLLWQGEEWGAQTPFLYFTDHVNEALGRAVTEGRRQEFVEFAWDPATVPDPQARETFECSKLRWAELDRAAGRELYEWYRALLALRRDRTAAERADREVHADEAAHWLTLRQGHWLLAANLAERAQRVPLPEGRWQTALASVAGVEAGEEMPPWAVWVGRRE